MSNKGFTFSDFFKALLNEAGLNYADFVKVSGVSRRTVANWANSDVIPAPATFKISLQALAKRISDNERVQKSYIDNNYKVYLSIANTVNYERSKKNK